MKHELDLKNYQIHTDLITELVKDKDKGYEKTTKEDKKIKIETIEIKKEAASNLNKKEGC